MYNPRNPLRAGVGLLMVALFLLMTPYWLLIWMLAIPGLAVWIIFWAVVGRHACDTLFEWMDDDY